MMNDTITSTLNESLPQIIKKNNINGTASFSNLLNETSKICNMTEKNLKATFGKLLYKKVATPRSATYSLLITL